MYIPGLWSCFPHLPLLAALLKNPVAQMFGDAVETSTEQSGEGQGQKDKGSHAQRSRQYRTAWGHGQKTQSTHTDFQLNDWCKVG
ncbi:hypothetical protein AMEX_G3177 [Astyanax mexicanus]|uniref:Uncharacterized protein n=1 Tax=Astyanax mexicanus TaxID=7994 RepID=A0A8T2MG17_ASTMX|nr:hypothetical protein AMEX_G3177 [Astyanax mexicanus]